MQLATIPLERLHVSALNMRYGDPDPDVSDILPSIAARGVYQPLLVRPEGEGFGVVAGRRRLFAARAAKENGAEIDDPPCAILAPDDDAEALEASILENCARLDPDEVSRWESFSKLAEQGRSPEDIAALFALPVIMVKRALALGALLPQLRAAYRAGDIDAATIRPLTLATKTQQRAWLKLFKSKTERAPRGRALKAWLFGGDLSTQHARFDLKAYKGKIVTDLFEERGVFADAGQFWDLQNAAIAKLREDRLASGWRDVKVLDIAERFHTWDHAPVSKADGGRLYIEVRADGEMIEHEGYLTHAERRRAERAAKGEAEAPPTERPELTKAAQNYVALHRHGAVQCELLSCPQLALRVMIAHALAGSTLWRVEADPLKAEKDITAESLSQSPARTAMAEEREAVLGLLGLPDNADRLVRPNGDDYRLCELLAKLMTLSDAEVMRVLSCVMAETLQSGGAVVEALGVHMEVDMSRYWAPDPAFYALLRDKAAINAMLAEIGGKSVADGNVAATAKTQKEIIAAFVTGEGREQKPGWLPRYLRFPFTAYTQAGAGELSRNAKRIAAVFKPNTPAKPVRKAA